MTNGPYGRDPRDDDPDRYDTAELDLGTQRIPSPPADTVVMPDATTPLSTSPGRGYGATESAFRPDAARDRAGMPPSGPPPSGPPTAVQDTVTAPMPPTVVSPAAPGYAPYRAAPAQAAPDRAAPPYAVAPGPFPGPAGPTAASVVATVLAESPRGRRPGARAAAFVLVLLLLAAYVVATILVVAGNSAAVEALAALPSWLTPAAAIAILTGTLLIASLLTLGLSGLGAGLGGLLLALTGGAMLVFVPAGEGAGDALRLTALNFLGTAVLLIAAGIGAHFARRDGFRRAQRATERALGIR